MVSKRKPSLADLINKLPRLDDEEMSGERAERDRSVFQLPRLPIELRRFSEETGKLRKHWQSDIRQHPSIRRPGQGKRPATPVRGFRLWGREHPVYFQYEILIGVADAVYHRHPGTFERVLKLGNFFHERDLSRCTMPHRIAGSAFFVNRCLNFENMKQTCESLLDAFDCPDDFEIIYG